MVFVLANFDIFPTCEDKYHFLGDVLIEKIKMTDEKHDQYPFDDDIEFHLTLLTKTLNEPYFSHELASLVDGVVTISAFAKIFANLLREWFQRRSFCSSAHFLNFSLSSARKK